MAGALITYDKELPEIQNRLPWIEPNSHLVKDDTKASGWREEEGRRPSPILLAPEIRKNVDEWRANGYPGASEVSKRLFQHWFEEDHEVAGFDSGFKFYFGQREAIETLVWLVEVVGSTDTMKLIENFATVQKKDMFEDDIKFQTTMDGKRQIIRYIPEQSKEGVQDLPPGDLRRFAFKLATGSGKTWVMAMAIVWSYFHKIFVSDSQMSTNFLVVAPNVIVYQRLEKDFANNKIFNDLPLIPPEWKQKFSLKVILRGDATEPDPSANLLLTNIQLLYESRDKEWEPSNPVDAILGKKPQQDLASANQRSMLERIQALKDLVVINDEAHHVHDEKLAWNKSLMAIHEALPDGLSGWLDFSATPKDQQGMFFPWTVVDYPLAQAVEDRIIKAPIMVTNTVGGSGAVGGSEMPDDPEGVNKDNVAEKYAPWIQGAVQRWKEHQKEFAKLDIKPVLFIMAEQNNYADALGKYLLETSEFGFTEEEVLVIHTDGTGEVQKRDVEKARQAARDIDNKNSKIKVIVSVMMLREGWDVRNVTVVLGLRPFTARAKILPEQVIGRGLRLIPAVGPERTQTLEVLGTKNLLNLLRDELEAEGVGVATVEQPPISPVVIEPVQERLEYDIAIPLTKPSLTSNISKLSEFDVGALDAIYDQDELEEPLRIMLKMEFATTESEVHQEPVVSTHRRIDELLADIAKQVSKESGKFAEIYPIVSEYVKNYCFGQSVDLTDEKMRSYLDRLPVREAIAKYLVRKIAETVVERKKIEFDRADFKLSETLPFSWRRDLPPLEAEKTVFNYVATYNGFERSFAEFLDRVSDVGRFAALGTTEQGSTGTAFKVDYLKPSGAKGFYYPDWVVVQSVGDAEVNWIIETKGREWDDTDAKDESIEIWCQRVSKATGAPWKYARVNQDEFNSEATTLAEVANSPSSPLTLTAT